MNSKIFLPCRLEVGRKDIKLQNYGHLPTLLSSAHSPVSRDLKSAQSKSLVQLDLIADSRHVKRPQA